MSGRQAVYTELQIRINPALEDIVADFCFENLPCEGVVLAEETYKDLEMISTTEGTLKLFLNHDSHSELVSESHIRKILTAERELLKSRGLTDEELGSWEFVISDKPNEDWSKKWKEKWGITHVSDKIVIVPDWLNYNPKADDVVIRLEPGCAFGTGTHQTTQLCMKAIEKYMHKDARVADIGTGSGILAICAKKFGASYVYGCDNDDTVIDVAKDNASKNNVECKFELNTADKITEKFDFILANILHNVLADIMGDLRNIMSNNGTLVLSGILDEKKQIVLDAINKHNLELIEEAHQDQWVAFIVMRKIC